MLRISCTPSHILLLALFPATLAFSQSPAPSDPAAPASTLGTYTAPDASASASLPTGWSITRAAETRISMTSPSGETIDLGGTFIVKNAPYVPNQSPADGIDLSVPNSASLAEKFTDIVMTAQYVAKASPPHLTITSSAPFTAHLGFSCATLDGSYTGDKGAFTFRAIVCSLPVDAGNTYKIISKFWQAPPAIAGQDKSLAEAVLASYRVPPALLQKKIAPYYAAPAATLVNPPPPMSVTECFDLAVLRGVPTDKLPEYCRNSVPSGPQ